MPYLPLEVTFVRAKIICSSRACQRVRHRAGKLTARWGGGDDPCAAGDFFAPHDICADSRGDIYVGEVVWSGGGSKGLVPATCHALQKFTRR